MLPLIVALRAPPRLRANDTLPPVMSTESMPARMKVSIPPSDTTPEAPISGTVRSAT